MLHTRTIILYVFFSRRHSTLIITFDKEHRCVYLLTTLVNRGYIRNSRKGYCLLDYYTSPESTGTSRYVTVVRKSTEGHVEFVLWRRKHRWNGLEEGSEGEAGGGCRTRSQGVAATHVADSRDANSPEPSSDRESLLREGGGSSDIVGEGGGTTRRDETRRRRGREKEGFYAESAASRYSASLTLRTHEHAASSRVQRRARVGTTRMDAPCGCTVALARRRDRVADA